jgi:hypothetical protein
MPTMRRTLERMRQDLAEIFQDLRPGVLSLDIFGRLAGPTLFPESRRGQGARLWRPAHLVPCSLLLLANLGKVGA